MKNKTRVMENKPLVLPFLICLLVVNVMMFSLDYAYQIMENEIIYSDYYDSISRRIQGVVCESSGLWLKLLTSQISGLKQSASYHLADFIMEANYIITGVDILDPKSFLRSQIAALGSYQPNTTKEEIETDILPIESAMPDTVKIDNGAGTDIITSGSVVDYFADDPVLLIYHTHTTEAYVPDSGTRYNEQNNEVTVVKVGAELADLLNDKYNIPTQHVTTNHVWEPFWASYTHSLQSLETALQTNSTINYVIDIHNDGVVREFTTTTIDGIKYARVYFVIGADSTRNPRWQKNYEFALRLQEKCEQRYPGLSRGILLRETARYNQHLCDNSVLIEMGGYQNKMEEALRTTRLLSELLAEVIIEDIR